MSTLRRVRSIAPVVIALWTGSLVAACSGNPTFVWSKPGATEAEMRQEGAQCTNEAYMVAGSNRYVRASDAYRNCMLGRGWILDEVR